MPAAIAATPQINGIRFHYLDWGNPSLPHVVLLHGGSLTAHTWDMAALLLRDRYHLVALDQRGHGDTDWTPEAQLGEDNGDLMLEDTRQFIEHLGFDHLTLVRHVDGWHEHHPLRRALPEAPRRRCASSTSRPRRCARVSSRWRRSASATETLSRFDDFLDRAMKFMPAPRAGAPALQPHALSLKQTDDGWTWKQDHRRRRLPALSPEEQEASRRRNAEALWADVKAISMPALLLRGAESKILSPEVAERTVAAMSRARLVVIPRATHNVHSDNPADFAAAVDAFLAEVLPGKQAARPGPA